MSLKSGLRNKAKSIREFISKSQKKIGLSFKAEGHIYFLLDKEGKLRKVKKSVTGFVANYYNKFDKEKISLAKAKGNREVQEEIIKEWDNIRIKASTEGTYVHEILENYLIDIFKIGKKKNKNLLGSKNLDVNMKISAGVKFIEEMQSINAELIDTEILVADQQNSLVGMVDCAFLGKKNGEYVIFLSDWKTNKNKSFQINPWTQKMKPPFSSYNDYAPNHYQIQLSLYCCLLKKMLAGGPFENMKIYTGIIVHLDKNGSYKQYFLREKVREITTKIYSELPALE